MQRLFLFCFLLLPLRADSLIRLNTAHTSLVFQHAGNGKLYEVYYGDIASTPTAEPGDQNDENEYYPPAGGGYIFEPALQVTHADGNPSTNLVYVKDTSTSDSAGVSTTRIELKDSHYPLTVTLCFRVFKQEDVIESWTEIQHQESGPVSLLRYASSSFLIAHAEPYFLTQFCGDYAHEMGMVSEQLTAGTKIIDSKLGVRADYYRNPSFMIGLGGPLQETQGTAVGGTLAWSGSFQFAFDHSTTSNRMHVLAGINPFEEPYRLDPNKLFTTPKMIWTWSEHGAGLVSRNLHHWAAKYALRDPQKPRPVLLNNWEMTGFDFDQAKILAAIDSAKAIGAETFLLDDGWFGTTHPRNGDHAGLGDWDVNLQKLPGKLNALSDQAEKDGIHFGIWLEPEMVNPDSNLFRQHPDWVITAPNREPRTMRNQMVLDLANPAVADYVWTDVVDKTFRNDPAIRYVKWDCNSIVYEPGSSYLKPEEQGNQLVDYNFALSGIMAKMVTTYPDIMGMACSGGGGRVDYDVMKYFDTFWASDNTDPAARVFIQWGYSYFFPTWTASCHVTHSGGRSIKFALDVAMSGALGMDINVPGLGDTDRKMLAAGVALYKSDVRELVQKSDLYRLESPYEGPRSSLDFVLPDQSRAILFVYQLHADANPKPVKWLGLDPARKYRIHEVDLAPGAISDLPQDGQTKEGAALMNEGLVPPCKGENTSAVIELN